MDSVEGRGESLLVCWDEEDDTNIPLVKDGGGGAGLFGSLPPPTLPQ